MEKHNVSKQTMENQCFKTTTKKQNVSKQTMKKHNVSKQTMKKQCFKTNNGKT